MKNNCKNCIEETILESPSNFIDFSKRCAIKKYKENSIEYDIAWKSILFGMSCFLTKQYWQNNMYSEDEVRKIINQVNTLSLSDPYFNEQDWFDLNK